VVLATGCGGSATTTGDPEASAGDASEADGAVAQDASPDGSSDAGQSDAAQSDAGQSDGPELDAGEHDAPEGGDAAASDAAIDTPEAGPLCPPGDYYVDVSFNGDPLLRFDRGPYTGPHAGSAVPIAWWKGPGHVIAAARLDGSHVRLGTLLTMPGTGVSTGMAYVSGGTSFDNACGGEGQITITEFGPTGGVVEGWFEGFYLGESCEGIDFSASGMFRVCRAS
jgi:hypothetical protein